MKTIKICSLCKKELPNTKEFFYSKGNICKRCILDRNKAYRTPERNKEYNDKKKADRRERKKRAVAYLGWKCESCGGSFHHAAYDFHHKNPEEKDVDPGLLMQRSDEIVFEELNKCILLCANCHRILHYESGTLGEIKKGKRKA